MSVELSDPTPKTEGPIVVEGVFESSTAQHSVVNAMSVVVIVATNLGIFPPTSIVYPSSWVSVQGGPCKGVVEIPGRLFQSVPMKKETPVFTKEQKALMTALEAFTPWDETEARHREVILAQVRATPLWWHRDTLPGHVTASGFVTDPTLSFLLLHHHRKLDRWLQLGGHDEGEKNPMTAVLREVREESGLQEFRFFGEGQIFDLDVHEIP